MKIKGEKIVDIKSEDKLWALTVPFNSGAKVQLCLPRNDTHTSHLRTETVLMAGAGGTGLKRFTCLSFRHPCSVLWVSQPSAARTVSPPRPQLIPRI